MPTIYLDRKEVEQKIYDGDNAYGRYVLAVAPDGSGQSLLGEQQPPLGRLAGRLADGRCQRLSRGAAGYRGCARYPQRHAQPRGNGRAQQRHDEDGRPGWSWWRSCCRAWEGKRSTPATWPTVAVGLNGAPTSLDVQWGGHGTEGWEPNGRRPSSSGPSTWKSHHDAGGGRRHRHRRAWPPRSGAGKSPAPSKG